METILNALRLQKVRRPRWVEQYFPGISSTDDVDYSDIRALTLDQAEALIQLLTDQVLYYEVRKRKTEAHNVALLEGTSDDTGAGREWRVRARLSEEAARDLCDAYRIRNPLD